MDIDLPGPHLPKCCFCIPLKTGAYIIGILSVITAIFGLADVYFVITSSFNFSLLAFCVFALVNFLPAIAFLMMVRKPSSAAKKRFASWWFCAGAFGTVCFLVLSILGGSFISGPIVAAVEIAIVFYFYLCLKAYAKITDIVDSVKSSLI